jgi:apolipoprotein N-acyltransferase
VEEFILNDKVLIIAIFSLLGIGILSVLFIAVPWLVNYALPNWEESLLDSGIAIIAVGLFVYGFYMNVKMH